MKLCVKCNVKKDITEFNKSNQTKDNLNVYCKACVQCYQKAYYLNNKEYVKSKVKEYNQNNKKSIAIRKAIYYRDTIKSRIIYEAKRRAVELNVPFNISEEDIIIPKVCPVLGIELFIGSDNFETSPSLDRVVPELGYVKSNINVISHRANRIKTDASLEELEKITNYVRTNARFS